MINLEVWVPPEFDTVPILDTHHVRDCGTVGPPVRFGWFIPIIKDEKKVSPFVQDIHWTSFRDLKYVENYDIQDISDLNILAMNSFINRDKRQ